MAQLGRRNASQVERRLLEALSAAVGGGEVTSEDDLRQRMSEEIDSIFTYTLNASAYVFGCDYPETYEEQMGGKAPSIEAQAACALEQNAVSRDEWSALVQQIEALASR